MKQDAYNELTSWEQEEWENMLEAEELRKKELDEMEAKREWLEDRIYAAINQIDDIKNLLDNELDYKNCFDQEFQFIRNILKSEYNNLIR